MTTISEKEFPVASEDGHRWILLARIPESPRASLLWLPAMGVAAKHYLPLADALAQRGVAVFLHEWRGIGSSDRRAGRGSDWGYRELLQQDLPASEQTVGGAVPHAHRIYGGHSLGGQLACCRLGLSPNAAQALWLVASGSPYWRAFPAPNRYWLPLAYRFLPWLAQARGVLPGRSIGFGGNEARGVVRDWARSGMSGLYRAEGLSADLESGMREVELPIRALALADDWLGPESSLRFLLSKLPRSRADTEVLDAERLQTGADHFSWMKRPDAVADALAS